MSLWGLGMPAPALRACWCHIQLHGARSPASVTSKMIGELSLPAHRVPSLQSLKRLAPAAPRALEIQRAQGLLQSFRRRAQAPASACCRGTSAHLSCWSQVLPQPPHPPHCFPAALGGEGIPGLCRAGCPAGSSAAGTACTGESAHGVLNSIEPELQSAAAGLGSLHSRILAIIGESMKATPGPCACVCPAALLQGLHDMSMARGVQ